MQNIQKDCYIPWCNNQKTSLTEMKFHEDKNLGESSADSFHSLSQKSQFKYSWKTALLLSPLTCIFRIFPLKHLNHWTEIKTREPEDNAP